MSRWTSFSTAVAIALGVAIFAAASSASDKAAPSNQQPPAIGGTAAEGSILNADHGRWHSPSPVGYAYQWRRCLGDGTGCADIAGATDRIYTVRSDDLGHTVRVTVTATNRDGSAVATSAQTPAVAALPAPA